MTTTLLGSCMCGGVTFEVQGPLGPPDACHCVQCRKQSGHYFASANVPRAALTISCQDTLRWYESSERARRGFCSTCGSSLFWEPLAGDKTAVAMGAFDSPTGTHLEMHIFVSERGDYYEIEDGLPQHAQWRGRWLLTIHSSRNPRIAGLSFDGCGVIRLRAALRGR